MSNAGPSKPTDVDIRTEARNWFVERLQPLSRAKEAEFQLWWAADPAHQAAYRQVEATWEATEQPGFRIAEKEASELAAYLRAMDRARAERKTFRRLAATSLILLVLLGAAVWLERPNLIQDLRADYSTARGERRMITLSDGTTVLLDADSALDEEFDARERRVTLLRGSAFFDIATEARPFVVNAANGEIRDIGTRFDVALQEGDGVVTLESGKVSLSFGGLQQPVTLRPGERIRFGQSGIGEIEAVNLDDALAWHDGRYVFYRARLADVVAEIARYRRGRIIIYNKRLADQIVTGSFSLAGTNDALASLQSSIGFHQISLTGALTVLIP